MKKYEEVKKLSFQSLTGISDKTISIHHDKLYEGYVKKWLEDFKALGLCSRGWTILGHDFNDGKLRNFLLDAHNFYGIWGTAPILVLDMYEHAYFIDFGADKKSYIETFFQNLNWQVINKKFQKIVG